MWCESLDALVRGLLPHSSPPRLGPEQWSDSLLSHSEVRNIFTLLITSLLHCCENKGNYFDSRDSILALLCYLNILCIEFVCECVVFFLVVLLHACYWELQFLFLYSEFLGNLLIYNFQGLVIQNLAVVSCLLSVSVSKVLAIQDLASHQIGLVRWDPTPPPLPVPDAGFDPRTSTSRVGRSTDWATWRPGLLHWI